MKIRRLNETDLARIATKSDDIKRKNLEAMKIGRPPFTYNPVRSCYGDIFNMQLALFGLVDSTSWNDINDNLNRLARSEKEFKYNKQIARALYEFASSNKIMGRKQEFFPFRIGFGQKLTYWLPMILNIDGRPYAVFIDPRRNRGLDDEGRRFTFSVMHERIRVVNEDFANAGLAIIRFTDPIDGRRMVNLYTDAKVDSLYSFEELQAMTASTYEIWQEVLAARDSDSRKKVVGVGPLFD